EPEPPLPGHRRPDPPDPRGLPPARRLRGHAAQGAVHAARGARHRARALRPARPRRRRLLHGQEGLLPAQGRDGQVPRLQRGRVRARDLQGPRAHDEEPARAHRGDHHRGLRRGREPLVHLHPRRVPADGRRPRPGPGRGVRRRAAGRADRGLRPLAGARGPPRRGRLHLRRGDRPPGLPGGQARQPAPQAAVSRQPGPLPGPDAHQQRRDARDDPGDHRDGRRRVRAHRRAELDGHEARLRLGPRHAPGQLRDRARHPDARAHLRPGRRAGPRTQ
ncbi:MAG: NADH-ubiquinone oxidoreductase chain F, partial [uncultured Rubrobacteraceae bacterium]